MTENQDLTVTLTVTPDLTTKGTIKGDTAPRKSFATLSQGEKLQDLVGHFKTASEWPGATTPIEECLRDMLRRFTPEQVRQGIEDHVAPGSKPWELNDRLSGRSREQHPSGETTEEILAGLKGKGST